MEALRISLFGKFHIRYNDHVLLGLDARKVQELFCYLLLNRDRLHTREPLASLLWENGTGEQARAYLRKALWQLQSALSLTDGHLLQVEPDRIQLSLNETVWLDVTTLEKAFILVKSVPGKDLDDRRAQVLEDAVQLYKGDLLEGWYQNWCLCERERLQHMYLALIDKLIDYCKAQQKYEEGIQYGMRLLSYDGAHERTHQKLMHLYYLSGDRTMALRQYHLCAAVLDEELSVQPSKTTEALYHQICVDQAETVMPTLPPTQTEPEAASPQLLEVLTRLQRLQTLLADVQDQAQQEIKEALRALRDRP